MLGVFVEMCWLRETKLFLVTGISELVPSVGHDAGYRHETKHLDQPTV